MHEVNKKLQERNSLRQKPPDPNKAVATPDTYLTTLGSILRNLKSPKSTFIVRNQTLEHKYIIARRLCNAEIMQSRMETTSYPECIRMSSQISSTNCFSITPCDLHNQIISR